MCIHVIICNFTRGVGRDHPLPTRAGLTARGALRGDQLRLAAPTVDPTLQYSNSPAPRVPAESCGSAAERLSTTVCRQPRDSWHAIASDVHVHSIMVGIGMEQMLGRLARGRHPHGQTVQAASPTDAQHSPLSI